MKRFLLVLVLATAALSQDVRLGEINGEVLDMMSKPVVNAQVVYTNLDTSKTYTFHTGRDGKFAGIGLMFGKYKVEVTGPTGKHIYSGERYVYPNDRRALNVMSIDLSVVATKASLVPFKGPNASDVEREAWRRHAQGTLDNLTPAQRAELRDENALIARYNELSPQVQSALENQKWELASTLLQQLIVVAPYKWELYQNLGAVNMYLGNYQEAAETFEKGIQVLKNDPEAAKDASRTRDAMIQMLGAKAEAFAALNQLDAAASQYELAVQMNPKMALAHARLCVIAYNNGHVDSAITACKKAIDADPTHPEYYQTLGQIQINMEKYPDAIQTYEKGISVARAQLHQAEDVRSSIESIKDTRRNQDFSGVSRFKTRIGQMLLAEGNAYFQLHKFQKAADLFTEATTMHPYPALAWFNLCATQFDMDKLKETIESCDHAIKLNPEMADAYFVKASALFGDAARHHNYQIPQDAVAALRKYLQLAPDGAYSAEANTMLREMASRMQ